MKIDIHTHHTTAPTGTLSILNIMPHESTPTPTTPCSVGLHPWHITPDWQTHLEQVRQAATSPHTLMIGECGLDTLHSEADIQLQTDILLQHINISESAGKPLLIHCVKAIDQIIAMKKRTTPTQPWIIHGFRGKPQQAHQLIDNGLHLTFGQHYHPDSLRLAHQHNRAWLETDQSELTITDIYTQAAQTLGITTDQLEHHIHTAARQLFANNPQKNTAVF